MSLGIPVRSLLAAMLVLPMMLGVLSTSTAAARESLPTGNGSLIITDSVAVTENVASHFGFNNAQLIGTTSVSKTASSSLIAPGQTASFTITITAPPFAPPGNVLPATLNFREFIPSGLTFSSITSSTSGVNSVSCAQSSGGTVPANADAASTQYLCTAFLTPGVVSTATFTLNTTVDAELIFSPTSLTNGVSVPLTVNDTQVTGSVVSATATVGGTLPTGLVPCQHGQVAHATLNPVGSSGVSAQLHTLGGGHGGLGTLGGLSPFGHPFQPNSNLGSGQNSFVLHVQSTTSSLALAAQTTSGLEFPALSQSNFGAGYGGIGGSFNPLVQINVNPFQQPGSFPFNNNFNHQSSTTYTGTFSGTPLSGGSVFLFSGSTLVAQGTFVCQFRDNNINIPFIPPPPPLQFIPPPPPPLLPPPPPAPMQGRGMMAEVPVIPEADSLFLLGGGLAIIGGLVAARALRRRDDA